MRRIAGWFLAGCVALSSLAGCGGPGSNVPTSKEKPTEAPKSFSISGGADKK